MHLKKIAVIGISMLIIVCCVIAAGCTSSSSSSGSSDNSIVGTWKAVDTNDLGLTTSEYTFVFKADGTGIEYDLFDYEYLIPYEFTWKKTGDNIAINYLEDNEKYSLKYNADNNVLIDINGDLLCQKVNDALTDTIIGSWVDSYTDENGLPTTCIMTFKWDGTGLEVDLAGNGNTYTWDFSWKKNGNGYQATYKDGDAAAITQDSANNALKITFKSENEELTYTRLSQDGVDPFIGVWTGKNNRDNLDMSYLEIIQADGICYDYEYYPDGLTIKFTGVWTKNGNVYSVNYIDGDTVKYTYNPNNDTITYQDGTVLTRYYSF